VVGIIQFIFKGVNMIELYKGADIIVDYEAQNNQDIIDHFEENSNFEGFARLNTIDIETGLFTIEGFPLDFLSLEYLIIYTEDGSRYYGEVTK